MRYVGAQLRVPAPIRGIGSLAIISQPFYSLTDHIFLFSLSQTSNPAVVDLMTPRTRMRLELDKLKERANEHDEIKKVYRDVHITIILPDGETKVTKEVSVGETVGNVKYAICEGAGLDYDKMRLFLQPKHEPMLELLSLNDFKYISEEQGEIIIKAENLA